MSGYWGTMRLAEEQLHYDISPPHGYGQGDWLEVVRACLERNDELDEGGGIFPGGRASWRTNTNEPPVGYGGSASMSGLTDGIF